MQPDATPRVRPIASLVSAPIEIERALMPALEESLNDYSKQEVQGAGEAQRVGAVMPGGADIITCKSDNGVTTVVDHETKTWYRMKAQYEFGAQVPSGTVMNGFVYWMPVEQGNEVTGNLRLTISFFDLQQRGLENFDRLPLLDMVMIDGHWHCSCRCTMRLACHAGRRFARAGRGREAHVWLGIAVSRHCVCARGGREAHVAGDRCGQALRVRGGRGRAARSTCGWGSPCGRHCE